MAPNCSSGDCRQRRPHIAALEQESLGPIARIVIIIERISTSRVNGKAKKEEGATLVVGLPSQWLVR